MSRIGKLPIDVPNQVEVTLNGQTVTVKGPLGTLHQTLRPEVSIAQDGNVLTVSRRDEQRMSRALHGLSRTLVANMVHGVHTGFTKNLEIIGVGYKATMNGPKLALQLGHSHPVEITPPEGITLKVDANTKISVSGPDKELVGRVASQIRAKRPPEPYKGKGVRYAGEKIMRKAGKAGGKK